MARSGRKPQHQLQYQEEHSPEWEDAVTEWDSNHIGPASLKHARRSKRGMLEQYPETPYRILNLTTGQEVK